MISLLPTIFVVAYTLAISAPNYARDPSPFDTIHLFSCLLFVLFSHAFGFDV